MSVSSATTGRPIRSNFLGLAFEYNTIPQLAGASPGSVDPVFAQLLRNLDPTGRPLIRVGGLSTGRAGWGGKAPAPPAKLILGVNLGANRLRISQVEASGLVSGLGASNVAALEIGNEPDLYTLIPWYKTLHGKPIPWYTRTGTPGDARR